MKPRYPGTWNDDQPLPVMVAVEIYKEDAKRQPALLIAIRIGFWVAFHLPFTFAIQVTRFLAGKIAALRHQ